MGAACLWLTCLLAALTVPAVIRFLQDAVVRQVTLWLPTSPAWVDARFRGPLDPDAPGALYTNVDFWLFNLTNVEGMRHGAKPHVDRVGPFSFRKIRRKLDVLWDRDATVSAKDWDYYLPLEGTDGPGMDAQITTLNLPLIGVVERVQGMLGTTAAAGFVDALMTIMERWEDKRHMDGIFVRRSVRELLLGYEDPLLATLSHILPAGTVPVSSISLMDNRTAEQARRLPPSVRATGANDPHKVWDMKVDRGAPVVTSWPGMECEERVRGSDGMQFRAGLSHHDRTPVWVPELFRSYDLVSSGVRKLLGLNLLHFQVDPAQQKVDPCKCQTMDGVNNITGPMAVGLAGNASQAWGPPILVSNPFFCGADPSLRPSIDGLPPCWDNEEFDTFLDIEPTTGLPLRVSRAAMISSQITHSAAAYVEQRRIRFSSLLPVYMLHEHIMVDKGDVLLLKRGLTAAKALMLLAHIVPIALLILATAKTWVVPFLQRKNTAAHKDCSQRHSLSSDEEQQEPLMSAEEVQAAAYPEVVTHVHSETEGRVHSQEDEIQRSDGSTEK